MPVGIIMQTSLKGHYDKIVMNVLASRGYENELVIQEHCTTSSGLHDLTLSLLRLVLLPGYHFLWQHLSWQGEQLWKGTDNWLFCIRDRKPIHEHRRICNHKNIQNSIKVLSASYIFFSQITQHDFRCNLFRFRGHFRFTLIPIFKIWINLQTRILPSLIFVSFFGNEVSKLFCFLTIIAVELCN